MRTAIRPADRRGGTASKRPLPSGMRRSFALLLLVLTAWTPQAAAACPMGTPLEDLAQGSSQGHAAEHHAGHAFGHQAPESAPSGTDHHDTHGGDDAGACPISGMCTTSLVPAMPAPQGQERLSSFRSPRIPLGGAAAPTPPLDPPPPRHPAP